MSNNQYGFKKGHSTIDAVSQLTGHTLLALNKNQNKIAVILDISRAFDTLDHNILLEKLHHAGVRGLAQAWFREYLKNRRQLVMVGGHTSSEQEVSCGIPQGSNLGPLLFSLYVNDLSSCVRGCEIVQFADDTTLYASGNFEDIIDSLNLNLQSLTQ